MPGEQALPATTGTAPSKEKASPLMGLMQPTLSMIPMIRSKRKKGKNGGALKKSRKVLAALVKAQIQIDRQHGVYLIKSTADPSKQFTYTAPHPKGSPTPMPVIIQICKLRQ